MSTPEGLCTKCSATQYCVEHEPISGETPPAPDLGKVIEQFVDSLFVNGAGERADRLVLTVDGPPSRDLGGWCRSAIVDRLHAVLSGDES